MNEKIVRHVEKLFEDAPKTRRAFELRDELTANLNDRYNDLIAEGKDEDTAYSVVIAGIGDVDELISGLRENDVFNEVQNQIQRQKSALLISGAVAIFILSIIPPILISEIFKSNLAQTIGILFMIMCWAVAVMMLVYNAMSKPKYEKTEDTIVENFKEFTSTKSKDAAVRKSIISIIPIITTIIYLMLGFGFNLWHPGWMIFLLIPVVIQIIRLVGIYRGDD